MKNRENITTGRLRRARVADFSDTRAEAFAERMVSTLNHAALALMISVGHRTRLFDVMAKMDPATSEEIANATGLQERYVREWLGAMVTGDIIAHDPSTRTYFLHAELAASLTRRAPVNLAASMQFIPLLAAVEDQIVDCFVNGGGVPYASYPRFHAVMAEESDMTTVGGLLEHILPLVPGLPDRLAAGIDALDVGCGRGHALLLLAATYPQSRFTGYDLSAEAIAGARAWAEGKELTNIRFAVRDVTELAETDRYDLITAFDAIHDQARPRQVLRAIAGALRDDGVFLMQDIRASSHLHKNIAHPLAPYLYTISCMHCMTVSLAHEGEGLGAVWGEEKARELLAEAGFSQAHVCQLPHDIINNYYIARR
ncbi:MAG: class I SAM-dependent methyltransferase [Blastocatellia bacterium]